MMLAATHFDPVVGVDVHMIQPPGPVPPLPIPHPYVGMHFDPFDYAPIIGSTIKVNGVHRAIAGTAGKAIPPHIPIGGAFVPVLPANEHEAFMGALTVEFDGDAANFMALPCLSCQSIGMTPPARLNPKKGTKIIVPVLPLSVVLPVPKGSPVLIGGPPTISIMSLVTNLIGPVAQIFGMTRTGQRAAAAARRAADRAKNVAQRAWRKAFSWMPSNFLKCNVLKAEPVDVRTGEVVVDQLDFELPGRIPLRWKRHYRSNNTRVGVCGRGWDTPADARLEFNEDGSVLFLDGDGTGVLFDAPPTDGPMREPVDGWVLDRAGEHYTVRKKGGLTWYFPLPGRGRRETLVEAVVDACRNSVHYLRGPEGLERVVESAGRSFEVVSRGGLVQQVVLHHPDFAERRVMARFGYDEHRRLTAVYDALDHPYRFGWHADGRMARHTNRVELSFYYEYDAAGHCVHSWGDGGLFDYRFAYDPAGRWTNYTDSLGHRWAVELDERGNIVAEIDPLGAVTSYAYDEAGRTVRVVDATGASVGLTYDEEGNLVAEILPTGATREARFADGCLVEERAPDGAETRYEHDARGCVTRRISPAGRIIRLTHDAFGDLVAAVGEHTTRSVLVRDRFGEVVAVQSGRHHRQAFKLDIMARIAQWTNAAGHSTFYSHDRCGRVVERRRADGGVHRFAYDTNGNVATVTHDDGRVARHAHDGLNQLRQTTLPDGTDRTFDYDSEARLFRIVNEHGQSHTFRRDAAGRVVEETDYWQQTRRYGYDARGVMTSVLTEDGRSITLDRDAAGRMMARHFDEEIERFAYDACGRLVLAANAAAVVRRAYDVEGHLLREEQNDVVIEHERDAAGRTVRRRTSGGADVAFVLDETGSLDAISVDGRQVVRFANDANGLPLREEHAGGLSREMRYDARGNLTADVLRAGGRNVAVHRFAYDREGRLCGRSMRDGVVTDIRYDVMDRVVERRGTAPRGTDARAQRRGRTSHVETDAHVAEYRHGQDGGLTLRRIGNIEQVFRLDALGRLVAVASNDRAEVTFGYDALGRRVWKRQGSETTEFGWDGDRLLFERGAGVPGSRRDYVYRPASFHPVLRLDGSESRIFCNDNISLPWKLLTADGTILWEADYDRLGLATSESREATTQNIRFQGQYHDEETGLCYNRFRYYDPLSGDYISKDPLGQAVGPDLYRYAPNPWQWVDPLGLTTLPCGKTAEQLTEEARKARDDFVAALKTPKERRQYATVVGAADPEAGKVVVGAKVGGSDPTRCAENLAAEQLGNKPDLIITEAVRPRTDETIPVCTRCQSSFTQDQFPPGTPYDKGGSWSGGDGGT